MKIIIGNAEITCTVDEFEELYTRGLLGIHPSTDKSDDWKDVMDRLRGIPGKQDGVPRATAPRDPFPTVALYGCNVPQGPLKPLWEGGPQAQPGPTWNATHNSKVDSEDRA